ncbi:DUF397 domain-containing protein [Streptomyces griseocarneus]|uniref:DUF397 domain-containing protein n=1 Tax=Streptomyces griseocarneus TaxID=51201 RepID=UPI00167D553C|nr:DUF397 domain-containing protein [Streptomyces griseocarneus]MBZ6472342.1 DUF397 domain-containing protein [Streptomyces griseocarneus]GHG72511.1 hypothetical protein GCM10018779_47930 [Streptomyces griseocarneus]
MSTLLWQKSSYSGEGDACLYIATVGAGTIHLRESDAPNVIVTTTPAKLRPLISRIKAGTLARAAAAQPVAAAP